MNINTPILRALAWADLDAFEELGIHITDNTAQAIAAALKEAMVEGDIVRQTAEDSAFGAQFIVRCPKCHQEIKVADSARWVQTCSCGYKWRVAAIGEKEE